MFVRTFQRYVRTQTNSKILSCKTLRNLTIVEYNYLSSDNKRKILRFSLPVVIIVPQPLICFNVQIVLQSNYWTRRIIQAIQKEKIEKSLRTKYQYFCSVKVSSGLQQTHYLSSATKRHIQVRTHTYLFQILQRKQNRDRMLQSNYWI